MKVLLLCLLLSDSTSNFTAKDARILAQNVLTNEQQRVYDYLKSKIYQQAEKKELGLIITLERKMFASIYDWRTNAQTWSLLMQVKRRLEAEFFIVDMKLNKNDEVIFEIKW